MAKQKRRGRGVDAKGRSKSQGQYLVIPYTMAHSLAWRSLSGPAVKLYIELRSRYNGSNNGDLSVSLDEAARRLGIGKATASRAFKELESKGFIKMNRRGEWYGRRATTYFVTDCSYDGHPPKNTWQKWRPPEKSDARFPDGPIGIPHRSSSEPNN